MKQIALRVFACLRSHGSVLACVVLAVLGVVAVGIMCGWQPGNRTFLNPDSAFMLWALKWWPSSILAGRNPFDANFFAPYGQNLAWVGGVPALALLAAPITMSVGPVFAYAAITAASLAANGILAYLVARELGCRRPPAFIAGLLFLFSSYTWAQLLGHLNLYVTAFAVAAIYITVRRIRGRVGRAKFICLCGILLALQFGVSNEIFATLIIFTGVAILIAIAMGPYDRFSLRSLAMIALDIALAVMASAVLVSPYLYEILAHPVSGLQDTSSYVADPLNYVIPTITNWLFGQRFLELSSRFPGNGTEQDVYLGIPVITLLIYGGWKFYKERLHRFLIILWIVIAVFSLGQTLTILGKRTLPLPWSIAEYLPFIREALPSRFGLYTSLISAILVARILSVSKGATRWALAVLAVVFLLPNIALYRMSTMPDASFFSKGTYKHVIYPGAHVLVLPTYGFYGYQPALWHEEADFSFDLVDGLAGKVPPAATGFTWFYYGGTEPPTAKYQFAKFMSQAGIDVIVSDDDANDPLSRLYRSLDLPFVRYGQLRVTRVSRDMLSRKEAEQRSEAALRLCKSLSRLASYGQEYVAHEGVLGKLTPTAVSDAAFRTRFGAPLPPRSSAANWTDKGYWLGGWETNLAVGYSPLNGSVANVIYRMLQPTVLGVYYPYPKRFNGDAMSTEFGQLVVVIRPGETHAFRCQG